LANPTTLKIQPFPFREKTENVNSTKTRLAQLKMSTSTNQLKHHHTTSSNLKAVNPFPEAKGHIFSSLSGQFSTQTQINVELGLRATDTCFRLLARLNFQCFGLETF